MTRVVILGGPTASGKSALASAIARAFDGTVINADSMQVYNELPILTAQPSAEARQAAPHRLYGVLSARVRCSAALWRDMARAEIADAGASGRLAIVVGGSGLYLRALLDGLAPVPEIPGEVRAAAERHLERVGAAGLHAALAKRDPAMAARLRPGDTQRLRRAWEVLEATGRSLAAWRAVPGAGLSAEGIVATRLVLLPPREQLYAACDARFVAMLGAGALAEARRLDALGLDAGLPAMKALGLRELLAHLRGETALEEAVAAAQQATRNYAKRQTTWFRHQMPDARFVAPDLPGGQFSERFLREIFNFIRDSG